jgi:hypothetical protein
MSDIDDLLEGIMAKTLAIRDVVVVLLANQAASTGDPTTILARISNGLSERIDDPELSDLGTETLEKIRAEVDWILGAAQKLATSRAKKSDG